MRSIYPHLSLVLSERDSLAKRLEIIEWKLKALVKVYFPSRYQDKLRAEDYIAILSEELRHVAEVLVKAKSMPRSEGSGLTESIEEERTKVYTKLKGSTTSLR